MKSLRKTNFFSQNPKIIFYYIFACVRAEEEKLKLMLQLDEVQLQLKSAEFRKPDMEFVQKFTPPDFKVKNFTPSISPYFNSFSNKKNKKT